MTSTSRAWAYAVVGFVSVAAIAALLNYGDQRFRADRATRDATVLQTTDTGAAGEAVRRTAPPPSPTREPIRATGQADSPWRTWRSHAGEPLPRLLLQLLVILAAARLCGAAARAVRQPAVVGEIAAGIALGPSLLGWWLPDVSARIFTAGSLGVLQLLAQVGVIFFMFVVGLELDWASVRRKAGAAIAVSHVSILLPFLLGMLVAFSLYRAHAPAGVSFHAFALFMGIAMSITAFPVLARILEERGLTRTPIGATALTCAAVDDVTAWTILAFVVAVVTSGGAWRVLAATIAMALLFGAVMVGAVRPFLAHALSGKPGHDRYSRNRLALVVGVVCAAALATEVIGIHALFGAFVAGAILPADEEFRRGLRDRLETFSAVILLPLFFAFTGLRTEVGLLNDAGAWLTCAVVIALATAGKFVGSAATARVMGMGWNDAITLGALMNTRGLMELIALNVGYDLGVISAGMFTTLVLMALVTTGLTGPMVDLARAWRSKDLPIAASAPSPAGAGVKP